MLSAQGNKDREMKISKREANRLKLESHVTFDTKKSVHINLTKPTHTEFRKVLIEHDLSMQEVFEWFAHLASTYDGRAVSIMKEAKINKRSRALSFSGNELENIYEALSEIDPHTS
jgi:hypothetical protein